MKKLLCTLALMACVTLFASAAEVGTIRNDYPGDTGAQAQMLYELGLFKGTEKGFELEKPMTRAEAAAMLTRFLGAEQTALAGEWRHPLTDVPKWADKYVGWLYENGMTKGVSETRYGAEARISCKQFAILLNRVISNDETYQAFNEIEIEKCDQNGFVRGDAVSLSTSTLSNLYYDTNAGENGNDFHGTIALKLIRQGAFTAQQFKAAAWDVLPKDYYITGLEDTPQGEQRLSCVIAGVPVVRNEKAELQSVIGRSELNQLYGMAQETDGSNVLYYIDDETLELTELAKLEGEGSFYEFNSLGA